MLHCLVARIVVEGALHLAPLRPLVDGLTLGQHCKKLGFHLWGEREGGRGGREGREGEREGGRGGRERGREGGRERERERGREREREGGGKGEMEKYVSSQTAPRCLHITQNILLVECHYCNSSPNLLCLVLGGVFLMILPLLAGLLQLCHVLGEQLLPLSHLFDDPEALVLPVLHGKLTEVGSRKVEEHSETGGAEKITKTKLPLLKFTSHEK